MQMMTMLAKPLNDDDDGHGPEHNADHNTCRWLAYSGQGIWILLDAQALDWCLQNHKMIEA